LLKDFVYVLHLIVKTRELSNKTPLYKGETRFIIEFIRKMEHRKTYTGGLVFDTQGE